MGSENTNTFPKCAARESKADLDCGVSVPPSNPQHDPNLPGLASQGSKQGICFEDLCLLMPSLEEESGGSAFATEVPGECDTSFQPCRGLDCDKTNSKYFKINSKVEEKESDLLEPICVLNTGGAESSGSGSSLNMKRRCKVSVEEKKRFLVCNENSCFVCSLELEDHDTLQEHLKENQFYCRVCTKEYNNHNDLEKHFMSHRCSKCQNCGNIFFCRKDYFQHLKKNVSCHRVIRKYPCDICGKAFSREAICRRHKLQSHSNIEGSFECLVCAKSYKIPWQLNEHLKALHVAFEYIQCKKCNKLLLGPDNFRKHMIAKHVEPLDNSAFVCDVCNKVFSKERTLKAHRNIHDTTTCTCNICGESLVGKAAMMNHKYREHPTSSLTVCSFCGKQFDSYKSLRNHKRRDHSRDKPAFCEICGKTLSSSSVLRKHMLNHSDERTFQCEVCGASFKQRVTLYNHSRVHKETDKYSCDSCEMTFRWKPTFDNHIKKCKFLSYDANNG